MNNSLKRAIDYLALGDDDIFNQLERGVDQSSLQLVANVFDIDPYVLLGKVWDRKHAAWLGLTEPLETVKHTVTDGGVFQVFQTATERYWVVVLENARYFNISADLGLFPNMGSADLGIRGFTNRKKAA